MSDTWTLDLALLAARALGFLAATAVNTVRALAVARDAEAAEMKGIEPVFVCAGQLRPALRRLVRTAAPRLPVLSYSELGTQLELETLGVVNLGQPAAV